MRVGGVGSIERPRKPTGAGTVASSFRIKSSESLTQCLSYRPFVPPHKVPQELGSRHTKIFSDARGNSLAPILPHAFFLPQPLLPPTPTSPQASPCPPSRATAAHRSPLPPPTDATPHPHNLPLHPFPRLPLLPPLGAVPPVPAGTVRARMAAVLALYEPALEADGEERGGVQEKEAAGKVEVVEGEKGTREGEDIGG